MLVCLNSVRFDNWPLNPPTNRQEFLLQYVVLFISNKDNIIRFITLQHSLIHKHCSYITLQIISLGSLQAIHVASTWKTGSTQQNTYTGLRHKQNSWDISQNPVWPSIWKLSQLRRQWLVLHSNGHDIDTNGYEVLKRVVWSASISDLSGLWQGAILLLELPGGNIQGRFTWFSCAKSTISKISWRSTSALLRR